MTISKFIEALTVLKDKVGDVEIKTDNKGRFVRVEDDSMIECEDLTGDNIMERLPPTYICYDVDQIIDTSPFIAVVGKYN